MGYPLLIEKSAENPVPHSSQPLPPPSRISVISVFLGLEGNEPCGSVGGQVDFEFCCGPADLQTQGREYAGVRGRRHVPRLGFIPKHLGGLDDCYTVLAVSVSGT